VRGAIDQYKKCEDVITKIMLFLRSEDFEDYFNHRDTALNVQIVCDILAEYPLNSLIQEMGCVFLRGVYEYGIQENRFDGSYACAQSIRLAVHALRAPNRTVQSVHAGMQLLLTLHKVDKTAIPQFILAGYSPA